MTEYKKTDLKGLNEEYLHVDPLQHAYRKWLTENKAVKESLEKHNTALLVIDLQYLDAAEGFGVFADAEKSGVPSEAQ